MADAGERSADRDIEFAQIAIEKGFVEGVHVSSALRRLNERRLAGKRSSLPQIMIEVGLLTKEQAKEVLSVLPTTELLCPNPTCGESFEVIAFDPGRKYACRVCGTALRPADDEDAGEIRRDTGKRTRSVEPGASTDGGLMVEADPRARMAPGGGGGESGDDNAFSFTVPDDLLPSIENADASKPIGRAADAMIQGDLMSAGGAEETAAGYDPFAAGLNAGGGGGGGGIPTVAGAKIPSMSGGGGTRAVADPDAGSTAQGESYNPEDDGSGDAPSGAGGQGQQGLSAAQFGQQGGYAGSAPAEPAKSNAGVVAFVLLLFLGLAGGAGYYIYTILDEQPTVPVRPNPNASNDAGTDESTDAGTDEPEPPTPQGPTYNDGRVALQQALEAAPDDAMTAIDGVLATYPWLLEARLMRGKLLWDQADLSAARQELRRVASPTDLLQQLPAANRPATNEVQLLSAEAVYWLSVSQLLNEELANPIGAFQALSLAKADWDNPWNTASMALKAMLAPEFADATPVAPIDDDAETGEATDGADEEASASETDPGDEATEPAPGNRNGANGADPRALVEQLRGPQWESIRLLTAGLILARGAMPGVAEDGTEDYNSAVDALIRAVRGGNFVGSQRIRAFTGLVAGAFASPLQSDVAADILGRAADATDGAIAGTIQVYRARIAMAEADREQANGNAELAADRRAAARTNFEEVAVSEQSLPRAVYHLASMEYADGNLPRAARLLRQIAESGFPTRMLRAQIQIRLGENKVVADEVLTNPTKPAEKALLAVAQIHRGFLDGERGAITLLEQAGADEVGALPSWRARLTFARYLRASLSNSRPEMMEARNEMADLAGNHPDVAEIFQWYGSMLVRDRDPVLAEGELARALELDPTDWQSGLLLAEIRIQSLSNASEAREVLMAIESFVPAEGPRRERWQRLLERTAE